MEKNYKQILVKNKTGVARFLKNYDLFFNLNLFHVFLIKFLNMISPEKNRNMYIFYKKKFKS